MAGLALCAGKSLWKSLTICILVIGWARDARARWERGERESDVRHRALGACAFMSGNCSISVNR